MIDSAAGTIRFAALVARLQKMFETEPGPGRTRTIVVIPSFTVDSDLLNSAPELEYWEHRMLYLLSHLMNPAVQMIYVTSREVSQVALNYYVDLLPNLSRQDLLRLRTVICSDSTRDPLAKRLLRRPDLQKELRQAVEATNDAYIECFASTEAERDLAYALDIPMYAPDPVLTKFGLKSQSRTLFRHLHIPTPMGVEGVRDLEELASALTHLKSEQPWLGRAVVKLDDSVGGVGNAVFRYSGCPGPPRLHDWVKRVLETRLELAMPIIDRRRLFDRISQSGCVVESYVENATSSPSVQCLIRPDGDVVVFSTHEQQLTGSLGQHFSGCSLPASNPATIHYDGKLIGEALRREGVIGWFGVDFLMIKDDPGVDHYALEINLRNVGTLHHLITLQGLTGGRYHPGSGRFVTADGQTRFYFGSDSVVLSDAIGLQGSDLLAYATSQAWTYSTSTQAGVVLHMIDAVKPYGRLGLTCIGDSPSQTHSLYNDALLGLNALIRK
jgi:hypothetical protein